MLALLLAGQYREGAIANIEAEINRLSVSPRRARARRRSRPAAGSATVAPLTADMGPQANPLLALEPPAPAPEDAP